MTSPQPQPRFDQDRITGAVDGFSGALPDQHVRGQQELDAQHDHETRAPLDRASLATLDLATGEPRALTDDEYVDLARALTPTRVPQEWTAEREAERDDEHEAHLERLDESFHVDRDGFLVGEMELPGGLPPEEPDDLEPDGLEPDDEGFEDEEPEP